MNNAGNMYRGKIDELKEDRLMEIFNSNVVAGMMLLGKVKNYLKESKGVNISAEKINILKPIVHIINMMHCS